jgi:hypothetical protein
MVDVEKDLHDAYELIAQEDYIPGLPYSLVSPIYKGSNENMNCKGYKDALSNNNKTLSVIGSGEQILNTIFNNSFNIDAFDISKFPEYYLKLRIGAIKAFNYSDYIKFFYSIDSFNQEQFDRVMEKLDPETRYFWEKLNNKVNGSRKLFKSHLFSIMHPDQYDAKMRNPYLESEETYNELKRKINNVNIHYFNESIYTLAPRLETPYDFINLSNICEYSYQHFKDLPKYEPLRAFGKFVKNLRITDDGKILNYLLDVARSTSSTFLHENIFTREEGYETDYVKGDSLYQIDGVAVYKKVRR